MDEHGNSVKVQWPEYTLPERKYMIYNSPELSTGEKLHERRCSFQNKVFTDDANRRQNGKKKAFVVGICVCDRIKREVRDSSLLNQLDGSTAYLLQWRIFNFLKLYCQ